MKKFYLLAAMVMASLCASQAKVGYLMTVADKSEFPQEMASGTAQRPEYNAAAWFEETYIDESDGAFISISDLKAGIDVDEYPVLWINLDRQGLADLAAAGIDAAAIAKVKEYVEDGGHLLLTKQACMLAYSIGRMGYAPGWGNGGYNLGGDTWCINAQLGLWPGIGHAPYDRRSHAAYDYVDVATDLNAYTYEEEVYYYETFPMVGEVQRTDNNNMWTDLYRKDPNTGGQMEEEEGYTHYDNGNYLRLEDFEGDWNCTVLGVWGHVVDFCGAGFIEYKPEGDYKGTILALGFAAYQWGTSNDRISNIQQLTESSIAYLVEGPTAVEETNADAAKVVKGTFDLLGRSISEKDMKSGNIYIIDGVKQLYK